MAVKRFKRNDEAKARLKLIEFLEHSYEGGAEYIKSVMKKHPKESASNFNRRKERAVFVNYCQPITDLYNQYVFRETISRDVEGVDVELYLEDADYMYTSHANFMRMVSKIGSVKGMCGIVIDKPKMDAPTGKTLTKADEIANDVREYASIYEPEHIIDWTIERINGRPTLTMLTLAEGDGLFKVWTRTDWKLYLQEGRKAPVLKDKGVYSIGVIPFIMHRNRNELGIKWYSGLSDIDSIAPVNKLVFYRDCQADEIIDGTAFAMLSGSAEAAAGGAIESGGQDGNEIDIGTSSFLNRDKEDPEYKYVEPAHTSLDGIKGWRELAVGEIDRLSRTGSGSSAAIKSGDALEIEFQDLNAILSEKAEMLEITETRIFILIGLWQGKQPSALAINITYPRRFGVRDLSRDIDNITKAKTIINSKGFNDAVSEVVARRLLSDLPEDEIDKVIESMKAANLVTAEALNADVKPQDTALNGAQVKSLLDIVGQVARGEIPRETGVAIIETSFNISKEEADELIGIAGKSFTPPVEDKDKKTPPE